MVHLWHGQGQCNGGQSSAAQTGGEGGARGTGCLQPLATVSHALDKGKEELGPRHQAPREVAEPCLLEEHVGVQAPALAMTSPSFYLRPLSVLSSSEPFSKQSPNE